MSGSSMHLISYRFFEPTSSPSCASPLSSEPLIRIEQSQSNSTSRRLLSRGVEPNEHVHGVHTAPGVCYLDQKPTGNPCSNHLPQQVADAAHKSVHHRSALAKLDASIQ